MRTRRIIGVSLLVFILVVFTINFAGGKPASQNFAKQEVDLTAELTEAGSTFATYKEVPVKLNPQVKAYQVDADLSNITNKDRFTFSPAAQKLLAKNGFVVVPSLDREFFSIYEINRYSDGTPNFVTTDAMLHNYHLYFSYLLRTLEKNQLRGELIALTESMLNGSLEQYQELKGTNWENAAKRNAAFFAVDAQLLGVKVAVPV
jgi:hypothetical protein